MASSRGKSESSSIHRPLNGEERHAILACAHAHGHRWKEALRHAWMSGNYRPYDEYDSVLQRIRNTRGPSWLVKFRLSDATGATRSGGGGASTVAEYEVSRPGTHSTLSFEDKEAALRYAARVPGAVVHPVLVKGGRVVSGSRRPDIAYVDTRRWASELGGGARMRGGGGGVIMTAVAVLFVAALVAAGALYVQAQRLVGKLRGEGIEIVPPKAEPPHGFEIVSDLARTRAVFVSVFGAVIGPKLLRRAVDSGWRYAMKGA